MLNEQAITPARAMTGADRGQQQELTRLALRDWAADDSETPAADDSRIELFAAFVAGGRSAEYADRIAAATLLAQAGAAGAKEAILGALDRMMGTLNDTIIPSELSVLAATIAAWGRSRLGETAATRLAGTMVVRHALVPRLRAKAAAADTALAAILAMAVEELAEGTPFGARPGSRLVSLQPAFARLSEAFDQWVRELVAVGAFALGMRAWQSSGDSDELVTQVEAIIADDAALAAAFMPPTPDDPLGTSPRCLLTAIGQAIALARQTRSTDYDWAAVQGLADRSPSEFAALLRDERLHVLDNLQIGAGRDIRQPPR